MPPSIGNSWMRSQLAGLVVHAAREDHRVQVRPVLGHPREVGAVRGQDAPRLVDDQPEDRVRVADRGDARGDLAQGPLGLGAAGGLLARPAELADQLRVVDGDRREVREGREERAVLLAEPARPRAENTASVPSTTASPISGANAIDRMPARSKNSRCGAPSGKRSSAAYSVGDDDAPLADREVDARSADAQRLPLGPGRRRRCPRRAPSGPRPSPGRGGR